MRNIHQNLRRGLQAIDEKWPGIKYCSLGLYSAWILLMMGGSAVVVGSPLPSPSGEVHNIMYLSSGILLGLVLFACGFGHKRTEQAIAHGSLVPLMSLLASVCTFITLGGVGQLSNLAFIIACSGTGFGTAFLCMRIGHMYSMLPSNRVFFSTFCSAVLANFIYFMCAAISYYAGAVVLSLMPFLASLVCLLRQYSDRTPLKSDDDLVPIGMLPRGFFFRCIVVVFVFAVAVGIVKGSAALELPAEQMRALSIDSVFISFLVALALLVAFGLYTGVRKADLSKIYYPLVLIACLVIMLSPLLGDRMGGERLVLVNVSYNIFILGIWCILANIAGQTTLSSIYVFGLGRGASGLGTTLGQLIAGLAVVYVPSFDDYHSAIAVCLAAICIGCMQFVMDEKTISEALEKTFREDTRIVVTPREAVESAVEERAPMTAEEADKRWASLCSAVAQSHGLTAREQEILVLLGRGRTAQYIAEELCISYNTTKGHVRNLYAKMGVHSRQELIDMLDEERHAHEI